jgi:hypothetical protein
MLGAALVSCKPEKHGGGLSCDLTDTGQALSGEWHLEATGKRTDCDDRRLEGEIEIDLAIPLGVRAMAQPTTRPSGEEVENEADAFVERIKRADYVLEAEDMPEDLELVFGSTIGSCVSFTLVERLPGNDSLRYSFDGYIVSSYRVVGTLEGSGPESCKVHGDFELTVY